MLFNLVVDNKFSLSAPALNVADMTEPFDASLLRLRQAHANTARGHTELETAANAPSAPVVTRLATPVGGGRLSASAGIRGQNQLDDSSADSAAVQLATASVGLQPGLSDDVLAKPRLGLAPRAALVAILAVLTLGGGVAAAYGWTASQTAQVPGIVIGSEQGQSVQSPAQEPSTEPTQDPDRNAAQGLRQLFSQGDTANPVAPDPEPVAPTGAVGNEVVVHVAGAVVAPGLVTLAEGARVADAIDLAGGATAEAELSAVNLARYVADGEQILVPKVGDVVVAVGQPATANTALSGANAAGTLINLNTADSSALQQLPGIGPALAERIIKWRGDNGGFRYVAELQEVKGIGPSIMSDLAGLVTV